jgi:O-antigen/teichoic acid export membrane protein
VTAADEPARELLSGSTAPLEAPEVPLAVAGALDEAGAAGPWTRAARLLRPAVAFVSVQALAQALALVAGFVLVRVLPVEEFALYTLASSVLILASVLSDLGATSSLLNYFRVTAGREPEFDRYVAAVRSLRGRLLALVLPGLALWFLLGVRGTGRSARELAVLLAAVVLAVTWGVEAPIRLTVRRLRGAWTTVYRAEIGAAAARALGAALVATVLPATAVVASGFAALSAWVGVALAGRSEAPAPVAAVAEARREVLRYLVPVLPDTVYFALQGQVAIWLSAFVATPRQVAEVGAVSRIGLVFAVLNGLATAYLAPKLVAIRGEAAQRAATIRYAGLVGALAAALVALAWLFPRPLLWVLGAQYADLELELRLVTLASAASLLCGFFVLYNRSRAWTRWLWLLILTTVLAQAAWVAWVGVGSTAAVLGMSVLVAAILLAGQAALTALGLRRPEWVEWR